MFSIHKITGDSMSPTIHHNDYILSLNCKGISYDVNDIVIVRHEVYGVIIKRIIQKKLNGDILLAGDNHQMSTSSSKLSWQKHHVILGKMLLRISPKNKYNRSVSHVQ